MSFRRKTTVLVAAAALAVLGTTGATAATHAHPNAPKDPTNACQVQFPGQCIEPVVAQSSVGLLDFYPEADAGLTAANLSMKPGTPVSVNVNNDLQNGTQDWSFNYDDYVGDGSDGMTAFDVVHYGYDAIISIEFTPFGQDSGLCLQPVKGKMVLMNCDGMADQAFILTESAPFDNPATHGYDFVLWAPQAANSQHHLAIDAPGHLSGQVTVQRITNVSPLHPSSFMWATIPY